MLCDACDAMVMVVLMGMHMSHAHAHPSIVHVRCQYVRDFLSGALPASEVNPLFRANQRLARADKIMRLATEGYAIMETMDPQVRVCILCWIMERMYAGRHNLCRQL